MIALISCLLCSVNVALSVWYMFDESLSQLHELAKRISKFTKLNVRNLRYPQTKITLLDAAEMVDIIRLGLIAGLSFDASLKKYCTSSDSRLSKIFGQAQVLWSTAVCSRKEALRWAARKTRIEDLSTLVEAIVQALDFGAPIADALASQAVQMRKSYRSSIEKEIEKTPVKILIPTATLILPALLLAILGPLLVTHHMI